MTYRIPKHVLFSLGTLTAGTLAAALAASCAQNDQGEPRGVLRGSATVNPTVIGPTPTIILDPCRNCSATDEDPCTVHCKNGVCGTFPKCDDGNPCTVDVCSSDGTCGVKYNRAECSDGDPCTTADVCAEGKCVGSPIGCNDNNTCTSDTCQEGNCVFSPVEVGTACNDQNGCTNSDKCTEKGVCVGSGGPDCDDGDPCTKNQCANSACYNTEYEAEGTPCLNANKCLVNTTCHANGECTSLEEKNCDDNNPCTVDSCDADVGCVNEPDDSLECDDGDICTLNDRCYEGTCVPESSIECTPIDECHEAGECDSTDGLCSDPRKPDGEVCETTGTCKAGRCEGGTPTPGGEGGAPSEPPPSEAGTGGEAPSAQGGSPSTPGEGGAAGEAAGPIGSGGDGGAPDSATGGKVIAPPPGAGGDGDDGKGEEFKRDPGGCSYGAASGPAGLAPVFALFGLAALGLRRRETGR